MGGAVGTGLHGVNPAVKLVLDTNIALDWLVFVDPSIAWLAAQISAGSTMLLTRADCLVELERVLAYPKFELSAEAQQALLARYRAAAHCFEGSARPNTLPQCRDPDDQKFLELARDGGAQFLVSKDKQLRELDRLSRTCRPDRTLGFRIVDVPGLMRALNAK